MLLRKLLESLVENKAAVTVEFPVKYGGKRAEVAGQLVQTDSTYCPFTMHFIVEGTYGRL